MRTLFRRILRFLESPRLATLLLVFLGAWSIVGTIVPQGDAGVQAVSAWDAAYGLLAPVAGLLGLHHAFSAPLFLAAAALLAISTTLCASRRTKVAFLRSGSIRDASAYDRATLEERHDLRIVVSNSIGTASDALDIVSGTLRDIGVRTRRRGATVGAVSPSCSTWGSPVFHWGLVAIMLAISIGVLTRSEGLMGVPVGRSLANTPDSYGVLSSGPLHVWGSGTTQIRVDDFKTSYIAGGIDRGPTPIVSVVRSDGTVLKATAVYPNSPLQLGTLTIHPSAWGFAVDASLEDTAGKSYGQATRLVDTAEETTDGTVPVGELTFADSGRQPAGHVLLTVPLGHGDEGLVVPADLQAHVIVTDMNGDVVDDKVVAPGGSVLLPTGFVLRIDAVGYYARLMVVEDITIPLLYAAMAVAMIGLTLTLVMRQQAIVIAAVEDDDGIVVYGSLRLWRNASTTREEIRDRLNAAFGADGKEEAS